MNADCFMLMSGAVRLNPGEKEPGTVQACGDGGDVVPGLLRADPQPPGFRPCSWTRLSGWGPRPDAAVAAECAARHVLVCVRALQAPYCVGAYAHDAVAVAYRVAGGLDPGNPRVPGPVYLMPLPAQQVADPAAGHLHDGR
jgi:hypothetical protein